MKRPPEASRRPELKRVWRTPDGEALSCVEKLKVLEENIEEIRQMCQDALEDAVLMGCAEDQLRRVLHEVVESIENPYRKE